jgi:hypothetical protein
VIDIGLKHKGVNRALQAREIWKLSVYLWNGLHPSLCYFGLSGLGNRGLFRQFVWETDRTFFMLLALKGYDTKAIGEAYRLWLNIIQKYPRPEDLVPCQ